MNNLHVIISTSAGYIIPPAPVPVDDPCPDGTWCLYFPGISKETGARPSEPTLIWRSYYLAGGKR
jgi:hypothetical protein